MMAQRKHLLGDGVDVDVTKLVESRLLVQANSGGGKSYAIRKLLEVTHGEVPAQVLDVEGEFHTLREKYDYVLAGRGGDCPATIQTAALLARRALELGFSAIIDISELGTQRELFVKRYLEALVEAPRDLWRPLIVVVDEAHKFCPEAGKSESADAVKDLMTRGRKRGLCGVLATQRIAKLSKDAAAECNNKLIGRSGLDVDMKRAGDELGFSSRESVLGLRKLKPGEFYAFGPAFQVDDPQLFKVGKVSTTHPKAGERAVAPTPPKDRVHKVLAQLADLPAEAEHEAQTSAELRDQVRALQRELRAAKSATPAPKVERREVPIIRPETVKKLEAAIASFQKRTAGVAGEIEKATSAIAAVRDELHVAEAWLTSPIKRPPTNGARIPEAKIPEANWIAAAEAARRSRPSAKPMHEVLATMPGGGKPTPAGQKILNAAALLEELGIPSDRETLAAWAGSHPRSKGYTNNIGALRSAGLMNEYALTDAGRAIATAPPASIEIVMRPLAPKQRDIVNAVLQHRDGLGRDELAELLQAHPRSKGYTNNIGALRGRGLLSKDWPIKPTRALEAVL